MSLTNRRRVPGSVTSSIMRAAPSALSGIDANSANFTVMMSSFALMGAAKGSFDVWANTARPRARANAPITYLARTPRLYHRRAVGVEGENVPDGAICGRRHADRLSQLNHATRQPRDLDP